MDLKIGILSKAENIQIISESPTFLGVNSPGATLIVGIFGIISLWITHKSAVNRSDEEWRKAQIYSVISKIMSDSISFAHLCKDEFTMRCELIPLWNPAIKIDKSNPNESQVVLKNGKLRLDNKEEIFKLRNELSNGVLQLDLLDKSSKVATITEKIIEEVILVSNIARITNEEDLKILDMNEAQRTVERERLHRTTDTLLKMIDELKYEVKRNYLRSSKGYSRAPSTSNTSRKKNNFTEE